MELTYNFKEEKKKLLIEVLKDKKKQWIDINDLPVEYQLVFIKSNPSFMDYVKNPCDYLKSHFKSKKIAD
jgi:hypothetical protein